MKRALLLCVLFVMAAAGLQPEAADEFSRKLQRFHKHYNQFLRSYLGCPKEAAYVEQCKPEIGTFDFSEFNYARKEAAPLFDLEKKKE